MNFKTRAHALFLASAGAAGAAAALAAFPGVSSADAVAAPQPSPPQQGGTMQAESGSHLVPFQVVNDSGYQFIQIGTDGKVANTSSGLLSTTPTTVNLTDDSSPTDQGDVVYEIEDSNSNYVGEAIVTFIDNWYHGYETEVSWQDVPSGAITATGDNTDGSTSLSFTNGSCGGSYSHGLGSIDQTIYNSTPYTLNLLNNVQYTNSSGGSWNTKPPATLAPGACAEINGYTDDVMAGFMLNATYTFNTPSGTQYALFSDTVAPETPGGGGLTMQSAVYTTPPSLGGMGYTGSPSSTFAMNNSDVSNNAAHPHLDTTISAR